MCLKAKNSCEVREIMYDPNEEIEASTKGEWIVDNLHLGDDVATPIGCNYNNTFHIKCNVSFFFSCFKIVFNFILKL
jgi:hypothetical protein